MPPAKKPATRRRASAAKAKPSTGSITRKEVEAATARFDKALDEATSALQTMRTDLGKSAQTAYKDVAAALRTLRANAKKSNRAVLKDIEKFASSVTSVTKSAAPTSRSRKRTTATKTTANKRTAATKSTAAKRTSARSASKPASKSTTRKTTAAKTTTAKRTTSRRPRAASK